MYTYTDIRGKIQISEAVQAKNFGAQWQHMRSRYQPISSWAKQLVFLHWNFFESANLSDEITLAFHLLAGRRCSDSRSLIYQLKGSNCCISRKQEDLCCAFFFTTITWPWREVNHICEWGQETNGMPKACSSSFFFRSNSTYATSSHSNTGILTAPWAMHLATGGTDVKIDKSSRGPHAPCACCLRCLLVPADIFEKRIIAHQMDQIEPNWSMVSSVAHSWHTHEIKRNDVFLHVGAVPSGSRVLSPVPFLYPVELKRNTETNTIKPRRKSWKLISVGKNEEAVFDPNCTGHAGDLLPEILMQYPSFLLRSSHCLHLVISVLDGHESHELFLKDLQMFGQKI